MTDHSPPGPVPADSASAPFWHDLLFEQHVVGVLKIHDSSGSIVEVNDRFCEMIGYRRAELIGQVAQDLVHPEDRVAFRTGAATYSLRFVRHDASVLYTLVATGVRKAVDSERYRSFIIQDLSALQEAHARSSTQEARLAGIVQTAMDAIITVDDAQHIRVFNQAAEQIFGYRAEEMIGRSLEMLLPMAARGAHHGHVERFAHAGATSRRMGYGPVLRGVRKSGEEFPIDASISRVEVQGERYLTVILRDVSARMRAEQELASAREELRQMSIASQAAREEEKSRISRELHDELGQSLTALKMDLGWLESRLPPDQPKLLEHVRAMQGMIDSTVAATRRIAADLRPLMLDDLGLPAALEWLALDFERRVGIRCKLDCRLGETEVDPRVATALFRTVQEALTNAARHSQASEVEVRLWEEDATARLIVEDNGRGFTDEDRKKRNSFGLMGIRERVYILGGTVSIASQPGAGTVIQVFVPCSPGLIAQTGVSGERLTAHN